MKIGYRDGVAVLHVLGAAAIEIAVFLDELEGVGAPVLALRLDHVQVSDDQDRFQFRTCLAAISGHHVALAIVGPQHDHVRLGKSRIEQTLRHGLSGHGGAAHRIGGVDFDELFEDVVRVLARNRVELRIRRGGSVCAQAAKNRGGGAGEDTIFQEIFSCGYEARTSSGHAIVSGDSARGAFASAGRFGDG